MPSSTSAPLVVVTGASSGIGDELADQLAQHGFDLIVAAERSGRLPNAATELAPPST